LRQPSNRLKLCYTPVYSHQLGVNVVFHNTQSLHSHFADLSSDPNFTSADVVCCAETRLSVSDTNTLFSMPDFELNRFDQQYSNSERRPPHGLALYTKDHITVLDNSSICMADYEWFHLRLQSPFGNFQIICFYCSPRTTWGEFRQHALIELISLIKKDDPVLLLGDFNQLAETPFVTVLRQQCGLRQIINVPTTIYGSRLDLLFTNISADLLSSGVIDTCWSDHRLLWCNVKKMPDTEGQII